MTLKRKPPTDRLVCIQYAPHTSAADPDRELLVVVVDLTGSRIVGRSRDRDAVEAIAETMTRQR